MTIVELIGAFYIDPSALSRINPPFTQTEYSAVTKRFEALCEGFSVPVALSVTAPPGACPRFCKLTKLPHWSVGDHTIIVASVADLRKACRTLSGSSIAQEIATCLKFTQ